MDNLRLKDVAGAFFSLFAIVMGVPPSESLHVGSLMGTKMVINEFVAYSDLSPMIQQGLLSSKSVVIASFALCGFANFSSIAIQLGGIGVLVDYQLLGSKTFTRNAALPPKTFGNAKLKVDTIWPGKDRVVHIPEPSHSEKNHCCGRKHFGSS